MKRSRKSNRVSWAPGVNLCQVKLFRKEDSPSQVGGECQDTLQAKTSLTLYHRGIHANELPPGFQGGRYANGLKYNLAEMPRIHWTRPPKVVLDFNWHVAAGEESTELEAQKQREMRVLEAVYPRLSVIPSSPSVSLDVEVENYDDSQTPLIPLTPIEDEEDAEILSDFTAQAPSNSGTAALLTLPDLSKSGTQTMPLCPNSVAEAPALDMSLGVSSDLVAAASVALTAVMKNKEQGSLIDTDLLIKILSDPKMVQKLINNNGYLAAANGNVVTAPVYNSVPETGVTSLPCPNPAPISSPMPADRNSNLQKENQHTLPAFGPDIVSLSLPMSVGSSAPVSSLENGNTYSTFNQMQPALSMMPVQPNSGQNVQPHVSSLTPMQLNPGPAAVKDANYIKNLIREYGREKEEAKGHNISQTGNHFNQIQNLKLEQNLKPLASKTKFQKHCIFFNKASGCRQGSNCPYLHEKSFQWQTGKILEAPSAKRMKLSWEITGSI